MRSAISFAASVPPRVNASRARARAIARPHVVPTGNPKALRSFSGKSSRNNSSYSSVIGRLRGRPGLIGGGLFGPQGFRVEGFPLGFGISALKQQYRVL